MSSYVYLNVDTVAPSGVSIVINDGSTATANRLVNLTLNSPDADTTQMLIWGYDGVLTESDAVWETYAQTKQITLTNGDGQKTIYAKFRDDVLNVSAQVSASILLNTSVPEVTAVINPSKISQNIDATLTFSADSDFVEYKVCVVPETTTTQANAIVIPTTSGSTGTSGTGSYKASTEYTATIKADDLLSISAGDGQKIVKVFIKTNLGTWSV